MAVIDELIRKEADGTLSFGNYELKTKSKLSDFEHNGDMYKVKTFNEITKLEKNGLFVYESVPGTCVTNFKSDDQVTEFKVYGTTDSSITIGLEPETEYKVLENGTSLGKMKTNLGGKLVLSVILDKDSMSEIKVEKS